MRAVQPAAGNAVAKALACQGPVVAREVKMFDAERRVVQQPGLPVDQAPEQVDIFTVSPEVVIVAAGIQDCLPAVGAIRPGKPARIPLRAD